MKEFAANFLIKMAIVAILSLLFPQYYVVGSVATLVKLAAIMMVTTIGCMMIVLILMDIAIPAERWKLRGLYRKKLIFNP